MKFLSSVAFSSCLALFACGRTDLQLAGGGTIGTDAGGRFGSGGVPGIGGRGSTGGIPGTGGRANTGGAPGTGGRGNTGGTLGTGGRANTGGAPGTGGRAGTGGAVDGGTRDGSTDRPVADAGPDLPPPTPGKLLCGIQTCDTVTQSCCVSIAVGAVGATCVPTGQACTGAVLDCDEPADCGAGTCCFGLLPSASGAVSIGSRCVSRTMCNALGRFFVCRTNGDCGASAPICCNSFGVPVCQVTCAGR